MNHSVYYTQQLRVPCRLYEPAIRNFTLLNGQQTLTLTPHLITLYSLTGTNTGIVVYTVDYFEKQIYQHDG
jgi:hypothetical protein